MTDTRAESVVLLKIPLMAEPDKQRFAKFVMQALDMFGISQFQGAARLPGFLSQLETGNGYTNSGHMRMHLCLHINRLFLEVYSSEEEPPHYSESLIHLKELPSPEQISIITETLRAKSEVSDPELLRLHNEHIKKEMALAEQRAKAELAELEEKLDKKRSQLQESIRAAEIDNLTQIYNRGAYDRRLEEAVKYCQRQGGLLSLILLDLDYFKEVNDTLGHQAGDEVLKKMAGFMQQYTRKDVDHVCRMGGDEFAIIFFTEAVIARRSAQKILAAMDGKVSIGIAQLTAEDSVESLIARADQALYAAKERGRGQVVTDSELDNTLQSRSGAG